MHSYPPPFSHKAYFIPQATVTCVCLTVALAGSPRIKHITHHKNVTSPMVIDDHRVQGLSLSHSPGWTMVPLFSLFLKTLSFFISSKLYHFFSYFSSNFPLFLSSFWPPGWATRQPAKALR